ncbi:hypothetical protein IJ096_02475 [Candidatus Saccharibacteria bacterium]|nr:hypothetical protein [Candidatus Saccharibacteria bacterium]
MSMNKANNNTGDDGGLVAFVERVSNPGKEHYSSAEAIGEMLKNTLTEDEHFYVFSPDETTSNKLSEVYEASERAWNLPQEEWDLPEAASGRVVELLSENVLMAMMIGHVLNCEKAVFASYEAFLPIVTSQIIQHCKFLTQCDGVMHRPNYPALNILSTSTCWRQDHNGYSHQSPALISTLLERPDGRTNCLFPVDDVAAAAAYDFMMSTENVVNLTTFNKTMEPRWIDSHHAAFQLENGGASIFEFASAKEEPDYVFTAAGDIPTREVLAAIKILQKDLPRVRIRFVGIAALTYGAIGTSEKKLSQDTFYEYFTTNTPIVAAFHGYPNTLRTILANYADGARLSVHGYEDRGSTTTPFEMLALNGMSRYDFVLEIAEREGQSELVEKYQNIIDEARDYAGKFGTDLINVENVV